MYKVIDFGLILSRYLFFKVYLVHKIKLVSRVFFSLSTLQKPLPSGKTDRSDRERQENFFFHFWEAKKWLSRVIVTISNMAHSNNPLRFYRFLKTFFSFSFSYTAAVQYTDINWIHLVDISWLTDEAILLLLVFCWSPIPIAHDHTNCKSTVYWQWEGPHPST